MRKAILVALGIVALFAYACCKVAGEADRIEELSQEGRNDLPVRRGGGPTGPPPIHSVDDCLGDL